MNTKLLYFLPICFCVIFNTTAQLAGSGKAYDFNSNYLNIPNSSSLSPTTAITLEAWILADSYLPSSFENSIISKDGWGTGNQGYVLRTGANGVLSFNFSSAGVWKEVATTALMTTGNWYHVAGTYDGATLKVYINGALINSLAFVGPINSGTYDVTIGKMSYSAGGTRYFDGKIDEARIWNTALTQAQIQEYMCKKLTSSHPLFANLAGYWNMDQTGTITDQSMNGNNATAMGATQVNSGAPIGDASVFSYASAANLTLANSTIDSATVTSSSTLPLVHLYRVDAAPLVSNLAAAIDSIDQTHYYGVYTTPTPASSYQFVYNYGSNPLFGSSEIYGQIAARATGSTTPWGTVSATQNQTTNTITYSATGRKEYVLAIVCPSLNVTPANNQNVCDGDTVHLTNPGVATNLQWFNGSNPIPGATTNMLDVSTSGVYHLEGNTGACAGQGNNVNVTVHPIPTVYFGDLDATYCNSEFAQPILNGSPANGTYSGPGIFGASFNPNLTAPGQHTLIYNYTSQYGCHSADTVTVTVGAMPPAPVITQSSGFELCTPACGTFTWSLNGTVISGATGNCYTATSNGTYTVFCTTTEGCVSSTASYTVAGLGLEDPTWGNNISIVPNPTKSQIEINLQDLSLNNLNFVLTDLNGKILLLEKTPSSIFELNLTQYDSGVYFFILQNEQNTIVRRVLKN